MKLDEALIDYLTKLARIACREDEKKSILQDLSKIINYVEMLDEVNTDGLPTSDFVSQTMHKMPLRSDVPENTLSTKDFLERAPKSTAQMINVPTVINKEEG